MKRYQIVLSNLLIVAGVIFFISSYAGRQQRDAAAAQVASFESMTVAMERVTANYLEQEQVICDSWANHINASNMSMQDAIDFIRSSLLPTDDVMAHVVSVFDDSLEGLSTAARADDPSSYVVSYAKLGLFRSLKMPLKPDEEVNITRAYTNPVNGVQSIAFYDSLTLRDDDGLPVQALLLRVVPTATLTHKWVFPTEEYEHAEISLIDGDGNYIIKGRSFKNSSFFEFYKSYNKTNYAELNDLERRFVTTTGVLTMLNSRQEECLVAHSPVNATEDWAIVSLILMAELHDTTVDWLLIVVISLALLAMLAIDLWAMVRLNRRERAAALAAAQANKAKSDFLSNMSHEIRTPITAILGMNELIQRESEKDSVLEYANNIQKAGKSLLAIISDILDFSKIEAGHMELDEVDYQLDTLVEEVVNLTRVQADAKHLSLVVVVDAELPRQLHGDVTRIKQVMTNLLSNAVKYTRHGSVRLELHQVAERREEGFVTMEALVVDTGIGIREEDMGKLFSAFDRLDAVHTHHIEGTGLGLAISKRMLNLMGSDLKVRSIYGSGSTFFFTLSQLVVSWEPVGPFDPLARPLDTQPRAKAPAPFVAPHARILVVDDTTMNLQVICGLLRRTQMHVDTAVSGEECIRLFGARHYDLVLLDYRMPMMDGIQTLARMRELHPDKLSRTPVICLTASAVAGDRERMLAAGFDHYLAKPVNIDELEDALVRFLPPETVRFAQAAPQPDEQAENRLRPLGSLELAEALRTLRGCARDRDGESMRLVLDVLRGYEVPAAQIPSLEAVREALRDGRWDTMEDSLGEG